MACYYVCTPVPFPHAHMYRREYDSCVGTVKETKFIVFYSALMQLFTVCMKCLSPCTVGIKQQGTLLMVKQSCILCGFV